jgi:hypothetical protein
LALDSLTSFIISPAGDQDVGEERGVQDAKEIGMDTIDEIISGLFPLLKRILIIWGYKGFRNNPEHVRSKGYWIIKRRLALLKFDCIASALFPLFSF